MRKDKFQVVGDYEEIEFGREAPVEYAAKLLKRMDKIERVMRFTRLFEAVLAQGILTVAFLISIPIPIPIPVGVVLLVIGIVLAFHALFGLEVRGAEGNGRERKGGVSFG